jgi:hypothetical protein
MLLSTRRKGFNHISAGGGGVCFASRNVEMGV